MVFKDAERVIVPPADILPHDFKKSPATNKALLRHQGTAFSGSAGALVQFDGEQRILRKLFRNDGSRLIRPLDRSRLYATIPRDRIIGLRVHSVLQRCSPRETISSGSSKAYCYSDIVEAEVRGIASRVTAIGENERIVPLFRQCSHGAYFHMTHCKVKTA